MLHLKGVIAAVAAAFACLAAASSAFAGVAVYTSADVPKFVADGADVPSTLTVPPGRTAIQSIDVTNYGYSWFASGQELSAQLFAPDGTSMNLFEIGCFSSPDNASFTLTDSAATPLPEKNGCDDVNLVGSSFRPVDSQNRKLSLFAGRTASGTWTLHSIDNSAVFTNQGSLERWALRITHVPPVLKASAPKASKLGALTLTATANANGTILTGGGAKPDKTALVADKAKAISYRVTKKVKQKIKKKGKARVNVSLAFTDETGGTDARNVSVTIKGSAK
jgi:hypothetical protein